MVIKRELNIDSKLDSEECVYGKVHRLQFGTRESATCPGELMSADFSQYIFYLRPMDC